MVEESTSSPVTIADTMLISDLETLKVLADPLRLSILEYLLKPSTVKRIAEHLNKPPTKLYYHFNLLEKHNLIQLVDTRVVSGIIEKHYQASARSYQVAKGLLAPGSEIGAQGIEVTLSGLFTDSRNDVIESSNAGVIRADEDAPAHQRMYLTQLRYRLTDEQAQDLYARLMALLNEFSEIANANEDSNTGTPYKGLVLLHPTVRGMTDDTP